MSTVERGGSAAVRARIDELVSTATSGTGLDDFGGDSWRRGLEVLVGSALADARFNEFGEQSFYDTIVRLLTNRLRVEDWYARHPEIDNQECEVELLGVGFPRTGSTALSHLLAEDDAFRDLRIWEADDPCPPPGVDADADEARKAKALMIVDLGLEHMPEKFQSMLPRSATGPIEDHDMLSLEFTSQVFLVSAELPTYADWFAHCDMEQSYRYEKRVLKLLQWKTPQKTWRIKSPTHTLFLEDFEKVFPDARFVQTHRDVSKVLPSVSDLYFTMLSGSNVDVDPVYVGELNTEQWGLAMDRLLAFRSDPAREARFFDIGFTAFQADPIAQIRGLYEWLGDDLDDATVARMLAWRADNPRDKFGRHTYDGEQFGITEELLSSRFGAYRERFGPLL